MMKIDLSRHAPPGLNLSMEKNTFLWGGAAAICWSFSCLFRLADEHRDLYKHVRGERVLQEGAIMTDFYIILGSSLLGFAVLALVMLAFAVYHYAYHRQGSKSIYLMRRLPNGWELHRRCLTIPIVSAVFCMVAAFILLCVYYWIYVAVTPKGCLTPGQWQKIWRLWI